jgi:ABC-type dipeptide/oligopeptide/nickel transport system ATPase subunit
MLGLCPPDAGSITWLGRKLDRRRRYELRRQFQELHQDPTTVFAAQRRLGHSLDDLARIDPGARRALPGLLERLRVSPDLLSRRPGEVSGGDSQRIALARALALRPVLMVADEPCSRLDPPTQAEALHLLRELVDDSGMAVLLITHDQTAAAALADATIDLAPIALSSA